MSASASYNFRHLSSTDGLPFSWIGGIFKDADGDMWLSSIYGAYCYDGVIFKEYSFSDPADGTIGQVRAIWQGRNNHLYFGTTCGLFEFDKSICRIVSHSFDGRSIHGLADDSLGTFWVATNCGIFHSDEGSAPEIATVSDGNSELCATSILTSSDNSIWAGTLDGRLLRYDRRGNCFNPVEVEGLGSSTIETLFEDSSHNIWLSTPDKGAFRYDPKNGSTQNYSTISNLLPHNLVRAVAEDSDKRIWIGTEDGIAVLKDDDTEIIRSESFNNSSLNDNAVYSLYCDSSGNMWVGTFFGGVNIHMADKPLFESLLDSHAGYSSESKVVSCIAELGDNLLVGTENHGLLEISPEGEILKQISSSSTGLDGSNIHSICIDSKRNLWVGTYYSGLYVRKYGSNRFSNYCVGNDASSDSKALTSNNIYKVYEDSRSNLWIGTQFGGLYRYNFKTCAPEKVESGLPGSLFVWDILEGRDGKIWLACYGAGIWCLDPDADYKAENIESEAITSISLAELSDGRILVGTEKEGLVEINPLTGYSRSLRRLGGNFPDNTVYAILCDADRNIWVSTNSGLYKSDEKLESFSHYSTGDGLPTDRFNYNAKASINGRLFFGSINGIVAVNPQSIGKSEYESRLRFNALYINNTQVEPGGKILPKRIQTLDKIVLGPGQNMFAIGFTDYDYSDKNLDFQYRLKGASDGWNMIGKSRRIDFAGLGPGRYSLELARYVSGEAPIPGASLQIRIKAKWWQSSVAVIIMLVVVLVLIALIVASRNEAARKIHELEMKKLQHEKESEINDLKYGLYVDIPQKLSAEDNILVRKLSSYIFENISVPTLNVDDLCEQVGMSKSTLYRKLKTATGLSANEFILNLRVKNAAKLLSDTQKTVSEIAYEVGFADPYYFSRAFKKIMDMSPKQWRSNKQK